MNTPSVSRSTTSTLATVSLIFGILTWIVLPLVGAIVAVVCGHLARKEIRQSPDRSIDGDGLAVAGLVLGYVHLAFAVVGATLLLLVMFGLTMAAHP